MNCHRCQGLMCPMDLLDLASNRHDSPHAWRCIACGEIIDQVIVLNRIRVRQLDLNEHRKLRSPSIRRGEDRERLCASK